MPKERILLLKYQNEEKKMHFFPKKFEQLSDYFLSVFNKKSSNHYSFFGYVSPDIDNKITLKKDDFQSDFNKIKSMKNPVVFIEDFTENNEEELNRDKINIKYVEEHLTFLKDDSNYVEEFERKKKLLETLEKRINNLEKGIKKMKNMNKNENLIKLHEEYKKENLELIKKINSLKK